MNLTFLCPNCEQPAREEIALGQGEYACPHCQQAIQVPANAWKDGKLQRCLICPSDDLFVRKDFPQALGVGIVVVGFVASSIPWAYGYPFWTYVILFATAGLDVLLYAIMPNSLMCYRCGAQYRSVPDLETYEAFDLTTHERHRQSKIRLAEARADQARRAGHSPEGTLAPGAASGEQLVEGPKA
ncbi:MAG: hypothetical protein SFX18_16080 [Pirellulales bacterium]|nr:hypothetical protein [Pirellulales bacterium]